MYESAKTSKTIVAIGEGSVTIDVTDDPIVSIKKGGDFTKDSKDILKSLIIRGNKYVIKAPIELSYFDRKWLKSGDLETLSFRVPAEEFLHTFSYSDDQEYREYNGEVELSILVKLR